MADFDNPSAKAARPRGRPPIPGRVSPTGGGLSVIQSRVRMETRTKIEALALAKGMTMSSLAGELLDHAIEDRTSFQALLGRGRTAWAIRDMISFANIVRSEIGDPETSPCAQSALMAGWLFYLQQASLRDALTEDEFGLASGRSAVGDCCARLIEAENALPAGMSGLPMIPLIRAAAAGGGNLDRPELFEIKRFAVGQQAREGLSQIIREALRDLEAACDAALELEAAVEGALKTGLRKGRDLMAAIIQPSARGAPIRLATQNGRLLIDLEDEA